MIAVSTACLFLQSTELHQQERAQKLCSATLIVNDAKVIYQYLQNNKLHALAKSWTD